MAVRNILAALLLISLYPHPVDTQAPPLRGPKSSFINLGQQALASRDFVRALNVAKDCLIQYPRERKCQDIANQARIKLRSGWAQHLTSVPPADLRDLQNTLEQLALYDPAPTIRQRLEETKQKRAAIQRRADEYLQQLHSGPFAAAPIPEDIRPFLPHLPELQKVTIEAAVHQALANTRNATTPRELTAALQALSTHRGIPEVDARIRELNSLGAEHLNHILAETREQTRLRFVIE